MKKPVLIGILFFLVVVGVVVYSTLTQPSRRVEVCVSYHGLAACRTASGSTEEFALRTATSNACAQIASGVTDSIACEHATPVKVNWLK
jgi:hypothetical protein